VPAASTSLAYASALLLHISDFHSLAFIKELYSSFRAHTSVAWQNAGQKATPPLQLKNITIMRPLQSKTNSQAVN